MHNPTAREGVITRVTPTRHFGFILPVGGGPVALFTASDLLPEKVDFTEQLRGRRVRFTSQQSPKGPRAIRVELL